MATTVFILVLQIRKLRLQEAKLMKIAQLYLKPKQFDSTARSLSHYTGQKAHVALPKI